jgi:hypothetical protein
MDEKGNIAINIHNCSVDFILVIKNARDFELGLSFSSWNKAI